MYSLKKIAADKNETVEVVRNDLSELVLNMVEANDNGAGDKVSQVLGQIDNLEGSTDDKLEQLLNYIPEMPVDAPVHPVFAKLLLGDAFQPEQPKNNSNGMGGSLAQVEQTAVAILEALPDSYRAEIQARRNQEDAAIQLKYTTSAIRQVIKGQSIKRQTMAQFEGAILDAEISTLIEDYQDVQAELGNLLGTNYRLTNEANKRAAETKALSDQITQENTTFLDKLTQFSKQQRSVSDDVLNIFRSKNDSKKSDAA